MDPEARGIRPGLGFPPNLSPPGVLGQGRTRQKKVASIFFIFGPWIEKPGPADGAGRGAYQNFGITTTS